MLVAIGSYSVWRVAPIGSTDDNSIVYEGDWLVVLESRVYSKETSFFGK